ncbi:hypothetical protein [Saccharopolyspora sp. CA-218241]|uniref:hypothetical protein n=1 Tax=Saccharopolyspora sp. CA-218241 TaxID=3240027 RepID=UPI003D99C7A6
MTGFRRGQRRFPPEFRIHPPPEQPPAAVCEPEPEPATADLDDRTVAEVATRMWRVLKRFSGAETSRAQRMAIRDLTAMSERLGEAGVHVQSHDGISWDPGMSLQALAYEPRPHLERETVVETERPTIYRGERCIQFGHVIIGVPEEGQGDGTGNH